MRKQALALFIVGTLAATAAAAQNDCTDGTIVDDRSFETGYGWQSNVTRGTYVMRIVPPATPARLDSACVCWFRESADTSITFDVNVWAPNGPGGGPGTLLGRLTNATASVSGNGGFQRVDLSSLGIIVNGPVYIGPSWRPDVDQNFFVCGDTTGTVKQPAYSSTASNNTPPAVPLGTSTAFPDYSALGVRAKFTPVTAGTCTPSSTALCLNNGRFRVQATFRTAQGQTGNAQAFKLTDETGYFWFFNQQNVEVVTKVLNGCGFNNRYWVFAAGLTNVRVDMTVTDTATGATRTYINPLNNPFPPIQDTNAFATCP